MDGKGNRVRVSRRKKKKSVNTERSVFLQGGGGAVCLLVMQRGQVIHSEIIWLSHVAQVPVADMTQSNRPLTARVEMAVRTALDSSR